MIRKIRFQLPAGPGSTFLTFGMGRLFLELLSTPVAPTLSHEVTDKGVTVTASFDDDYTDAEILVRLAQGVDHRAREVIG